MEKVETHPNKRTEHQPKNTGFHQIFWCPMYTIQLLKDIQRCFFYCSSKGTSGNCLLTHPALLKLSGHQNSCFTFLISDHDIDPPPLRSLFHGAHCLWQCAHLLRLGTVPLAVRFPCPVVLTVHENYIKSQHMLAI